MNSYIDIENIEQLAAAAQWLTHHIERSNCSVVALYGEMGVGKTTLIGEFCGQQEILNRVSSPTFSIVNPYQRADGQTIYHFDFYRIDRQSEAIDIGVFDYFDSGSICLVEWPQKIEDILAQCNVLSICIELKEGGARRVSLIER